MDYWLLKLTNACRLENVPLCYFSFSIYKKYNFKLVIITKQFTLFLYMFFCSKSSARNIVILPYVILHDPFVKFQKQILSLSFGESKVIRGYSTVQGMMSPTPALFKGRLYVFFCLTIIKSKLMS